MSNYIFCAALFVVLALPYLFRILLQFRVVSDDGIESIFQVIFVRKKNCCLKQVIGLVLYGFILPRSENLILRKSEKRNDLTHFPFLTISFWRGKQSGKNVGKMLWRNIKVGYGVLF